MKTDQLLTAIREYRAAYDAHDAYPDSKTDEAAFFKALATITNWNQPATTAEGAIEALRLVQFEAEDGQDPKFVNALVEAVVRYIEGRAT